MVTSPVFRGGLAAFALILAVACLALVSEVHPVRNPGFCSRHLKRDEKREISLGAAGGEVLGERCRKGRPVLRGWRQRWP